MEMDNINNVTEMAEEIEHVEGDVINDLDTVKEAATNFVVTVSDEVGDGISKIATGVGILAITGTVTIVGAAGYGLYKGCKWLGGRFGSKKQKNDEQAAEPAQAENAETAQEATTDNKKVNNKK